jgi:hypothetical protein
VRYGTTYRPVNGAMKADMSEKEFNM